RLLVLLLRLFAPAVVHVERTPRLVRPVCEAAVPDVGVEDEDVAGAGGQDLLLGMAGGWIPQRLGGQAAGAVGAGDHAEGAVLGGDVVEHPQRVADPGAALVGEGAAVGVQGLVDAVVRVGRAGV